MNRRKFLVSTMAAPAAVILEPLMKQDKETVEFPPGTHQISRCNELPLGTTYSDGHGVYMWCQYKGPAMVNVGDMVMSDQVILK